MKLKCVIWVGQSKKALINLPEEIKQVVGYSLYIAQNGSMPDNAKVLKGFGGAGVIEIIASDNAGTYRTVYTVKMADMVFVLHVFQKKSKQGIKTPQQDMELIYQRLKMPEEIYRNLRLKDEKK